MVESPNKPSVPDVPPANPVVDDDPLSHLHRMSRTAGMASQDYVAVSPQSVAALIFGVASALAIVDPMLVVIPIVGLVISIFAIRQIRNSGGTQTGSLMAWVGLVLSIGFLGWQLSFDVIQGIRRSGDRVQVMALIDGLGKDLIQLTPDTLGDAYGKFDVEFTSRVTRQRFDNVWLQSRNSPLYGLLKSFESNGQLKFDIDPKTSENVAYSVAIVQFDRGEAPRWTMMFRQTNGKWYIDDLPDVFPTAAPPPPQQRR